MIYLIASIISSVAIGCLIKYMQERDKCVSMLQIFLGNYFIASIVSFIFIKKFDRVFHFQDLLIGIIFGSLYLINFLLYKHNIKHNGLGLSISVMRVSLVIPVVISLLFFNEHLAFIKYIGILVVLIAFSLMSRCKEIKYKWLLVSLFLLTGITEIGTKVISEFSIASDNQLLFYLFSSAFILNLIIIVAKKERIKVIYLLQGMILGVPNLLTSFFFLKALKTLDAAYAYPFNSSLVVLLGFVVDRYLFRNKFTKQQYLIFFIIFLGVILINIS